MKSHALVYSPRCLAVMKSPSEQLSSLHLDTTTVDTLPDGPLAVIFASLDLADLAAVEATCKTFLRVVHEGCAWLRLAGSLIDGLPTSVRATQAVAKALVRSASREGCTSLLAEALAASSTDNANESVANTLSRRARNRNWHTPCYWSSRGAASPDSNEWLLYRLCTPVCLVQSFSLRPFLADFQWGSPIYSPLRVRFMLGAAPEEVGGFGGDAAGWSWTSDEFSVQQADTVQSFVLPRPVLVTGGALCVQLLGRIQTQSSDGLLYICIAHVRCEGQPLYGWSLAGNRLEACPGGAVLGGGGLADEGVLASSSSSDNNDDQ
jgi:hypothetical protein